MWYLGSSVGIHGVQMQVLLHAGNLLRLAVNSGGGGNNHVFAVIFSHCLKKVDRAHHIVVVVTAGLRDAFSNAFEAGEVDDGVKPDGDGRMHYANGERKRERERKEGTWSGRRAAPNRSDCGGRRDRM